MAKSGIYSLLLDALEQLYVYHGVSYKVMAEVFNLNPRTMKTRLADIGASEVKQIRDRDVAEDKKMEMIAHGDLPPSSAHNLSPERQFALKELGINVPNYVSPPLELVEEITLASMKDMNLIDFVRKAQRERENQAEGAT